MSTYTKDPDAVLDYTIDWSGWLPDGDTITLSTVIADPGITVDSSSIVAGTAVTIWLSGGTARTNYAMTSRIETQQGREDDRTITVQVWER